MRRPYDDFSSQPQSSPVGKAWGEGEAIPWGVYEKIARRSS